MSVNYPELTRAILGAIERSPFDKAAYTDLLSVCRNWEKTDPDAAHDMAKKLVSLSKQALSDSVKNGMSAKDSGFFYDMYRKALLFNAPVDFDSYLLYVEMDRPPDKKFYQPRRRVLRVLVDDLQDLADGKLDFLGISLPPRVGKSTLCIFFMTWIMGRFPDDASVMSGHSDKLTDGFYRELLSVIDDQETYLWHDVFPDVPLVDQSAKNETIDLKKKKRFPTITCRSVGGTLTGAVEIGNNGILYCDDLIEDLEESLNPLRLDAKYDAYLNQLKDRKKETAKELMVGTRWNVFDPLGRIQEQYKDNPRYRFRVIPALNDDDESNFEYDYKLGFSTEYYHDMRDSIDAATWWAKYMGQPYIRDGLLFPEPELNYYNGVLPDGDPAIYAVCDVAWGGGDSTSMPIGYQYGEAIYVHDWVFNNGDKTVTQPAVVAAIKRNRPSRVVFEANNGGTEYCAAVDDQLRADGYHINLSSRRAMNTMSKLARIIEFAPEIRRFYFLDKEHRTKEYNAAMHELTTFVQTGKNLHDDAADSLGMLSREAYMGQGKVEVFSRPF